MSSSLSIVCLYYADRRFSRFRLGARGAARYEVVFQFAESRLDYQVAIFEFIRTSLSYIQQGKNKMKIILK